MLKRIVLGTLLFIVVGLPLLFLATCTYSAHSPHLRLDPLIVDLMDAPRHPEAGWRTVDVELIADYLDAGASEATVIERLAKSGFTLWRDYSTDVGPRDIHLDDDMPQAGLDQMHIRKRKRYNALGATHIFERGGRSNLACGETLFIEIGLADGALTQATGYSRYTCL